MDGYKYVFIYYPYAHVSTVLQGEFKMVHRLILVDTVKAAKLKSWSFWRSLIIISVFRSPERVGAVVLHNQAGVGVILLTLAHFLSIAAHRTHMHKDMFPGQWVINTRAELVLYFCLRTEPDRPEQKPAGCVWVTSPEPGRWRSRSWTAVYQTEQLRARVTCRTCSRGKHVLNLLPEHFMYSDYGTGRDVQLVLSLPLYQCDH